jgi:hypothetical protein
VHRRCREITFKVCDVGIISVSVGPCCVRSYSIVVQFHGLAHEHHQGNEILVKLGLGHHLRITVVGPIHCISYLELMQERDSQCQAACDLHGLKIIVNQSKPSITYSALSSARATGRLNFPYEGLI